MLVAIFLLWIIFNGTMTLETTLLGIAVSAMLFLFARKYLGYRPGLGLKAVRYSWRGVRYAAVLVWETIKSNVYVSKIVYAGKIEIKPQMVFFRTDLKTALARVVLANSITLTPGTLTVVLTDDLLCVHCLNKDLVPGLNDSVFVKQLREFER